MVDKNSIFGGMLTTLGAAKKTNCDALGIPWEPRYMLIGDGGGADPVPSESQTKLVNQVYRAQLNQLRVSPTDANVLIAELVLPPDVGGWWIRELALEDKDGVFSAVANVAPSYKPLLAQGSGRNQVVRMHIITSGTSNIQLKIDPSVVLATRGYVDDKFDGLLPANKEAGTYTKVVVNDRGVFVSGSNPNTLSGMGITNAYTKAEVDTMINNALAATASNRLLGVRRIRATQVYTMTPGTKKIRVRGEGAGGAGGGAYSTGAGQISGGCGGSAGAFFDTWITSGFDGVLVTIGKGGLGVLAAKGGNGGATSFGAFATAPGGYGGGLVANVTPPSYLGRTPNSEIATGGSFSNGQGQSGGGLIGPAVGYVVSGEGGTSRWGAGGNSISQSGAGTPAGVPGAGGGGAVAQPSWPSNLKGGDGGDGWIEIEEWT
ncbi:phage tail protein [Pseudomonas sp. B11(2017)]|uniref:phage tail protein n=1 Tax=Pseudomonas sp. B11(2017) TaxID=1981748 RepID=UPI0021155A8D|nr:phage tail protein [Pseudomonas sp. B11(2017)]